MTKVQKKSSLCNEKIQCTCKSFNELQKIDLIIAEMEKTTVGKIPSKTGETSDKVRMLHGFIKKMIKAAAMLADKVENLKEEKEYLIKDVRIWKNSVDFWTERNKDKDSQIDLLRSQLGLPVISKINETKTGEGKILDMSIMKD